MTGTVIRIEKAWSAGDAPGGAEARYFWGWRAALLLAALFLVSAFAQIDRILPFILAEAIKADLLLSDTQIGLITGIAFALCYALLSLPMARLCDSGSPRMVLVACMLVWSAMTGLGGFAAGFLSLAVTRFGIAVGEAGAVPSSHAVIARKIPPRRRGIALGIFSMGIPLGTMMGFALGGAASDAFGWRATVIGAGVLGMAVAMLAGLAAGATPPVARSRGAGSFFASSKALLVAPAFRWLFIGAVSIGFAAAPFYAFTATFLIRTHAFSASEAGLTFGLLQGAMGMIGTLTGGRLFDRAVRKGSDALLLPPALAFLAASVATSAALFSPFPWLSTALLVPAMFAFPFVLPYAFGTAHLVAGRGREAMASSLGMIATGLIGPALGPLIVGLTSDWAASAGIDNGLGIGLLIVPVACVTTALIYLVAGRSIGTGFSSNDNFAACRA
jgi:predicted MFS family arabinose efflux permease